MISRMTFEDRFQGVWAAPYLKTLLFYVSMVLLIIGALNWLVLGLFEINVLENTFGERIASFLYLLVGISAFVVMFNRDTYLPFLGPTLAPCSVLQNREPPGATQTIKVTVTPNTKVIYWAAEPANDALKTVNSWKEAYAAYDNAGVTTSNGEGTAILKVRAPQSYKVPFMGKLDSHVHYRVCGESGFMGRVQTASVKPDGAEGFEYNETDKNYTKANLADTAASL